MTTSALNKIVMSAMPIALAQKPIAMGMSRDLYSVPGTDMIVKVRKLEPPPRRYFQSIKALFLLRKIYKTLVPLRREVREYRRVEREGKWTRRHLQRFHGVVETPRGSGLVVEAVRRPDGSLALNLDQLLRSGKYDARTDAALHEFLKWYEASSIVAADVHLGNIVIDETDFRLVLVDGIGDKTFIPVRSWFPPINKGYKRRLARAIRAEVALRFMQTALGRQTIVVLLIAASTMFGIDILDGKLIDG